MNTKPTESYDYDLIVIGGGCNGTGIARDAAMRGLRTLLVEKNDFGAGTTGYSSRMIHGGARYLLFDRDTTRLSCIDSGYIQKIVPHLLFRIPFLIPYLERKQGNWLKRAFKNRVYPYLMEAYLRAYDHYQPHKNGKPHTHLNREEALALEPGLHPDTLGALSMDEWGIDPYRLCLLNALSAAQHGATVLNHTEVRQLYRNEEGHIRGVMVRDILTGESSRHTARYVFNAAGVWSSEIARLVKADVRLRPGKGTHVVLDRRISNWGVATSAVDGRQIFFFPDQNTTIIGTTDDDYYGDLNHPHPTHDEIQYLLQGVERVFPSIRKARMIRAFSGLRPTLFAWGKNEENLSRAHRIYNHATEGAEGLLSIAGGKLASFRIMAEEAVDLVIQLLQRDDACRTHLEPLPGGATVPALAPLSEEFDVPTHVVERLVFRHGQRARDILQAGQSQPDGYMLICQCESVLRCEIDYVIQHEFVRKPADIIRRTRLGWGPCQGLSCARPAARIFTEHFPSWSIDEAFTDIQAEIWSEQKYTLQGTSYQHAVIQQHLSW